VVGSANTDAPRAPHRTTVASASKFPRTPGAAHVAFSAEPAGAGSQVARQRWRFDL